MADPAAGIPAPAAGLHFELVRWDAGRDMHRFHRVAHGQSDFNASGLGNARFSPIRTATGKLIPTLYGGSSFECAAMETVFHEVPFAGGFKSFDKNKLDGWRASVLRPVRDLKLIDLSGKALRKLGIARNQLIDTETIHYPHTRPWAAALHAQCPEADGLQWVSRQDDEAKAVVLFGDRLRSAELKPIQPPVDIVSDPDCYAQILALAQRIGVIIMA
jgi:hypothetical protein